MCSYVLIQGRGGVPFSPSPFYQHRVSLSWVQVVGEGQGYTDTLQFVGFWLNMLKAVSEYFCVV